MSRATCLAALALLPVAAWAGDPPDMHFRAFSIEPADRIAWGEGHVMTGLLYEKRPENGTKQRNSWPAEWTVGLPAGFALVGSSEALAHTVFDEAGRSSSRTHEILVKYALPEREGLHLAVMTGQASYENTLTRSYGVSANLDTHLGSFGAGVTWDRKHPGELHGGREAGINWFQLGQAWGMGAELRTAQNGNGQRINHWLLGVARVVDRDMLVDFAFGGSSGYTSGRLVTAGFSWFY